MPTTTRRHLPPLLTLPLRVLAWAYVGYLALCLLVLLPALNFAAPWATERFLNRELRHELLLFNPFTLTLELRSAQLLEPDKHQPLALDRLQLNLAVDSIWEPGIVLDAIDLRGLDVHVLRHADGHFHFEDLVSGEDNQTENSADGEIPGLTIRRLQIDARNLRFTDRTRQGGYSAAYHDLALLTEDLSTLPDRRGDGAITLTAGAGGTLRWQGDLALGDGLSGGRVEIDNLDLSHLWRYEAEQTHFAIASSGLDLQLDYRIRWQPELSFALSDGHLRLHSIDIVPAEDDLPDTQLSLQALSIDGISVDSSSEQVNITRVAIDGMDIAGFDQQGEVSLLRMLSLREAPTNNTAQPAPVDSGAAPQDPSPASSSWSLQVEQLALNDGQVRWHSDQLAPEQLQVAPLSATVSGIRWPGTSDTRYALQLAFNRDTTLNVDGRIDTDVGNGDARITLEQLPLDWFNPQLTPYLNAAISGGSLGLEASINVVDYAPATADADLTLDNFSMQISGREESMVALQRLDVQGAQADLAGSALSIESVVINAPQSGLHILEDGSLNLQYALRDTENDAAGDEPAPAASGAESSETPASWALRVDRLQVHDGRLDFSDDSLPIPFAALIGDIEADIRSIDSSAPEPIEIALEGAVDGYAPVLIEGSARPFADSPAGELHLDFRGIDIATMTPYSGTYAGYAIDSGTLSLDLRYRLDGRSLDGDNRVVISQMQLGEPVESDLAMEVPLKLGIALLTDAEGIIDLEVPISGDVDNPEFSLGKVIGRAIANVIVKAATAPFRLLAGLVGSDQDLEQIAFAAGSSTLDDTATSALGTLAEALKQRPKLQLQVAGWVDRLSDRDALRERQLTETLRADGLSEDALRSRDADFVKAVEERYGALALPESEDGEIEVSLDDMVNELLARIEIPAALLRDLGTQRAIAVKRQLVTVGGIDAERISVSYSDRDSGTLAKMTLGG